MTQNPKDTFLFRSYTDTIRGICMLLIVFSHTANEFPGLISALHLSRVLQSGTFATGIFFFLSGYGLTLSLERNSIDSRCLRRRLSRLFIPYLFFWAFYTASFAVFNPSAVTYGWITDFLSLKMPEADTWFFRVIVCCCTIYMSLYKYVRNQAAALMALVTVTYMAVCMIYDVPSWWYNTVICFPLGILHAKRKSLRTGGWRSLTALIILFIFSWKFYLYDMIIACGLLSVIVARMSVIPPMTRLRSTLLSFIGINSLWVYFMEAIPIDLISSHHTGFFIYVSGGVIISVVLAFTGVKLYTLLKAHC